MPNVQAYVLADGNGTTYTGASGSANPERLKTFNSDDISAIRGIYWFQPQPNGQDYLNPIYNLSNPAPGSFQALRITYNGTTYYLDTLEASLNAAINQCCGADSYISDPVYWGNGGVPVIYPTFVPGANTSNAPDTYTFTAALPVAAEGNVQFPFTLTLVANGTTVGTSTSLANAAAALTYANTNWSSYGTWSLTGYNSSVLQLVSTTVTYGTIAVTVGTVAFQVDLTAAIVATGQTFTQLNFINGVTPTSVIFPTAQPITSITQMLALLQPYFTDSTLTHTLDVLKYTGGLYPVSISGGNLSSPILWTP